MYDDVTVARFWDKVAKAGAGDCWRWTGRICKNGYGGFSFNGRNARAHRMALMVTGHTLPAEMVVDHICRNRACVNPAHLRIVTPRVNALENNMGPTAANARKTHCPRGHPLSGGNLRPRPDGCRECRTCATVRNKRAWQVVLAKRREQENTHG